MLATGGDLATTSGRTFEAAQHHDRRGLYPSHVKLGQLQRAAVAVLSAVGASIKYADFLTAHFSDAELDCVPMGTLPAPQTKILLLNLVLDFIPVLCSPARADLVAAVGETTGESALRRMLERMQATTSGRDILAERPRITVTLHPIFIAGLLWDFHKTTDSMGFEKRLSRRKCVQLSCEGCVSHASLCKHAGHLWS